MEESSPIPPSLSGQPDLFALDLKVESFSTNHPSGLKSYFKGRVLKWVVDRKSLTVDAMRFQAAYAGVIASMTDKSEWPEVDLGFKVHPPVQTKNVPGRPRKVRIRGWMEPMRRTVKCKRCK
uniref:Uncharacterized protein n=1 Tax=Aegilops tauschii subsp. strangulata TaxID=200361 RepID=A0A453PJQ1_AEGTS